MSGRWRALRGRLAQLGIERTAGQAEPEDHAAILCEIMAGACERPLRLPEGADAHCSRASRALDRSGSLLDLEQAEACGVLPAEQERSGGCLCEIRTEAFALPS